MSTVTEPRAPEMYVIDGLPDTIYHPHPALGYTDIKNLLAGPAYYRDARDNPRPGTDAQDLGTVTHALALGTGDRWVVSPYDRFQSNEAKAWKAEQQSAGIAIVKAADLEKAKRMADALHAHPDAAEFLAAGNPARLVEASAFAAVGGAPCKARFDVLIPHGAAVDIKTVGQRATAWHLARQMHDFKYYVQAGHYRDVLNTIATHGRDLPHVLLWVETEAPHCVAVTRVHPDAVAEGQRLAAIARERWLHCTEADSWPGAIPTLADLDLPPYAYRDDDLDLL